MPRAKEIIMRRFRASLLALTLFAPTAAHATTALLDPDGRSLTATLEPWVDSLFQVFLMHLGI